MTHGKMNLDQAHPRVEAQEFHCGPRIPAPKLRSLIMPVFKAFRRQLLSIIQLVWVCLISLLLVNCGGSSSRPSSNTGNSNGTDTVSIVPSISSLSPSSVIIGSSAFNLTINGSNFSSGSRVYWNGYERTTTFVSTSILSAAIMASDLSKAGKNVVAVQNSTPNASAASNNIEFSINYPIPALTLLYPMDVVAGSGPITLIIYGNNFVAASSVQWGSLTHICTFINTARIAVALTTADLTNSRVVAVSVTNPSPGGGSSNTLNFRINAPGVSILTKILPDALHRKQYAYSLQAGGGIPPYSWSIASGALPSGINLSANGEFFGIPPVVSTDATFAFAVRATDSSNPPLSVSQPFLIAVRSGGLGRNDQCSTASTIPNGVIRASISPYGDIDVYSFHGTQDKTVTMEVFAQRLTFNGDPTSRDVYLDSFLELLDSNCSRIRYNDDIDTAVVVDSSISYVLPKTGTYYIRVSDLRGEGRPDFFYELHLSGAD
jgi:hypothetical protein